MRECILGSESCSRDTLGRQLSNYLILPIPPLEIVPNLYFQAQSLSKGNETLASRYLSYIGDLTAQYNTVSIPFAADPQLLTLPTAGSHQWRERSRMRQEAPQLGPILRRRRILA